MIRVFIVAIRGRGRRYKIIWPCTTCTGTTWRTIKIVIRRIRNAIPGYFNHRTTTLSSHPCWWFYRRATAWRIIGTRVFSTSNYSKQKNRYQGTKSYPNLFLHLKITLLYPIRSIGFSYLFKVFKVRNKPFNLLNINVIYIESVFM